MKVFFDFQAVPRRGRKHKDSLAITSISDAENQKKVNLESDSY